MQGEAEMATNFPTGVAPAPGQAPAPTAGAQSLLQMTKPPQAGGTTLAPPTAPTPYTNPTSPGVSLTPTNPQSDLRGQTIGVGPTADRMGIANTYAKNWSDMTAPQYQADLRSATSQAAGAGQLGSGQLRTSLGDLAYNRGVQQSGQEGNFLNTALQGTIGDAYQNAGIAQQQQQFQAGLQNQTFNQGLQSLLAGNSGNPSATQLALSGNYGQQAAAGQQGVGNIISGATQNNNNQAYQQQILNMIGRGQPATQTPSPVGTPIYNTSTTTGQGLG